jgi:hypothetical protein
MSPVLLSHEIRRCGVPALLGPPAAGALLAAVAAAGALAAGTVGISAACAVFPLIAGIAVTDALGREALVELHLTLPVPYRSTVARRALVAGAGAFTGAALFAAAVHGEVGATAAALTGLTTLLLAVGAWAAVSLPSTAAAAGAVIGAWLAVLLVLDRFLQGATSAVLLIALALVVTVRAHRVLDDPERLLMRGAG